MIYRRPPLEPLRRYGPARHRGKEPLFPPGAALGPGVHSLPVCRTGPSRRVCGSPLQEIVRIHVNRIVRMNATTSLTFSFHKIVYGVHENSNATPPLRMSGFASFVFHAYTTSSKYALVSTSSPAQTLIWADTASISPWQSSSSFAPHRVRHSPPTGHGPGKRSLLHIWQASGASSSGHVRTPSSTTPSRLPNHGTPGRRRSCFLPCGEAVS
jgi:hypothetical protein